MPHLGRTEPSSSRKEDLEFESPIMSYKGLITGSRAKFINLVTHLDSKEACEGDREFSGQNEKDSELHNSWR